MTRNIEADMPRSFGCRFMLRIPYVLWQNFRTSWRIRERLDPETKQKKSWTFYIDELTRWQIH